MLEELNYSESSSLVSPTTNIQSFMGIPSPSITRTSALMHAGQLVIEASGDDPQREGLQRTPERFAKAYKSLLSGYSMTIAQAIGQGVFQGEGKGLVTINHVEFYSLCEHHLLPFWGTVRVAYYPQKNILGLSKVPRIIDMFARRMQVQERLTREICEAIVKAIDPRAAYVAIRAQHMCMMMRGVEKQNSDTFTEFHVGADQLSPLERDRLYLAQ